MTISHEQIKLNVATEIADNAEIRDYFVEHLGGVPKVLVNRYGEKGFPGEAEAPFVFVYSDGENQAGDVDEETFEFCIVVGAVDPSESPRRTVVRVLSNAQSGLVVEGIADRVEHVRELILGILRKSNHGAIFRFVTKKESSLNDYPLEWAEMRCSYYEPNTLDECGTLDGEA